MHASSRRVFMKKLTACALAFSLVWSGLPAPALAEVVDEVGSAAQETVEESDAVAEATVDDAVVEAAVDEDESAPAEVDGLEGEEAPASESGPAPAPTDFGSDVAALTDEDKHELEDTIEPAEVSEDGQAAQDDENSPAEEQHEEASAEEEVEAPKELEEGDSYALAYTQEDGGAVIVGYAKLAGGKPQLAGPARAAGDDEYAFTEPTTYDPNLVIPSEIDGRPVTAIGPSAFEDAGWLETVATIYPEAFRNCSELRSASLPAGLGAVGSHAFAGCSRLVECDLPEGVRWLESPEDLRDAAGSNYS